MKLWYLLYCKRGDQQRAKLHLENQNVECFYPEIDVEKMIRGKRTTVKEPLFPCYMFVRFDFTVGPTFTTIRSTRGISDFVRFGSQPTVLNGDLIYSLKQLGENLHHKKTIECLLESGQKVDIIEGPYTGIDAIYKEADGEMRSILLITLINKKVEIKIENINVGF